MISMDLRDILAIRCSRGLLLNHFMIFFIGGLLSLYLTFSSAIQIESIFHDDTQYFAESLNPQFKKRCANYPPNAWQYIIGRPMTAVLDCLTFKLTSSWSDLVLLRFAVIAVLAFSVAMLATWLVACGLDRVVAFAVALAIFVLPTPQYAVFITNFPLAVAPIFTLLSSFMFMTAMMKATPRSASFWITIVASFFLLFISFLTYPAISFMFLLPCATIIAFQKRLDNAWCFRLVLQTCIFFGIAAVVYMKIYKLFIPHDFWNVLPNANQDYAVHFATMGAFVAKLSIFLAKILPMSFIFWNTLWSPGDGVVVMAFCVLLAGIAIGWSDRLAQITRLLCLLMLVIVGHVAWLLMPGGLFLFRILFAGTTIALVFAYWSVRPVALILTKQRSVSPIHCERGLAGLMALTGVLLSNFTMTENVRNANMELMFVRDTLASHITPISRVHVIRPPESRIGFNGLDVVSGDEFNHATTSYRQDVANFVRVALLGFKNDNDAKVQSCTANLSESDLTHAPVAMDQCVWMPGNKDSIMVTQSAPGERVCRSDNMVVVDMNVLAHATRTGEYQPTDMNAMEPCSYRPFTVTASKVNGNHGIRRAFDESVRPDDFWEVDISSPVTVDISYESPTLIDHYGFATGDAAARMPKDWVLLGSNDGNTWITLDERSLQDPWSPYQRRLFQFDNHQPFLKYRFVFKQAFDPRILRVYEILL